MIKVLRKDLYDKRKNKAPKRSEEKTDDDSKRAKGKKAGKEKREIIHTVSG